MKTWFLDYVICFFCNLYVVKNAEILRRVKEERNILYTIKSRKANWIGDILRRNCHLKHVIEGKTDMKGWRRRRLKQPLDDFKEKKTYSKLKEKALDCTVENSLWKRLRTCRKTDYRMKRLRTCRKTDNRMNEEYCTDFRILCPNQLLLMQFLCTEIEAIGKVCSVSQNNWLVV
jgi:hypothetical protein